MSNPGSATASSVASECKMLLWRGNTSLCSLCAGYPEHMSLSDFRCHFQALSPPIMKRYASMFVNHDERKVRHRPPFLSPLSLLLHSWTIGFPLRVSQAVEELLTELDLDRRSVIVGASRVRALSAEPLEWRPCVTRSPVVSWRCSWSVACYATWSNRETSRSPAGLSTCKPPAWDTWPGKDTASSRWDNDPCVDSCTPNIYLKVSPPFLFMSTSLCFILLPFLFFIRLLCLERQDEAEKQTQVITAIGTKSFLLVYFLWKHFKSLMYIKCILLLIF